MSNTPIASVDTPDPWILHHNDTYYLTFTLGNRVEIWQSSRLESFHSARKSLVWQPSASEHWNTDLWAPELHFLRGTWYIYFCGAPKTVGNPGHRTLVLRSRRADPMDVGGWEFCGPLRGVPEGQWSIDATVFEIPSRRTGGMELYCCYSGWPLGDQSDTQQDLFLVKLRDPENAIPETLTCISRASLPWERPEGGRRGVNEGPTFLSTPPSRAMPGGFQGIVFSAHGSWGPEYKLGILALIVPSDPCREDAWVKRQVPLLVSDERKGPFGPGHASFVSCQDGTGGVFCIYHGTERRDEGWANRKARVLRLDGGCFGAGAGAVCCAGGPMLGGGPGPVGGGASPGYPGASGSGGMAAAMPVGHTTGKGAKVWGEVEKLVPGQYKGYLDKAKKFF